MGDEKNSKAEIARLIDALRTIADGLGEGATVDRVLALLTVAQHTTLSGSIDQNELAKLSGILPSTMSRNVAALSDIGNRGRDAMKLIDVRFDPADRRRRMVSTSSRGEALIAKAIAKLHGRK
jgi:DNA-binding MarR family transcriptional regulator